jgi:hypothetical protein
VAVPEDVGDGDGFRSELRQLAAESLGLLARAVRAPDFPELFDLQVGRAWAAASAAAAGVARPQVLCRPLGPWAPPGRAPCRAEPRSGSAGCCRACAALQPQPLPPGGHQQQGRRWRRSAAFA